MKRVDSKLLDEIVSRLVAEFDPEQIYIFGSHAWGTPTEDSDLDLLVIVSESNERPTARATRGYHAVGDIMVPIDILVKTRSEVEDVAAISGTLVADIVTKGKVLYASDKAFAIA
ncbi:MAG: nucleotidyltransferase domain-containing protein [Kiritimatiellia bacterium]|nr:nucleotidyltransferase domain-containing protein [Kiritimatiellia bacterium]